MLVCKNIFLVHKYYWILFCTQYKSVLFKPVLFLLESMYCTSICTPAFSGHGSVSIPVCMHIVHLYRARERFRACEWFTRGLLPVPGVSPSQHILATRGKNKCSQVRWMYRCVAYYMLTRQGYLQSISQSIGQCVSEWGKVWLIKMLNILNSSFSKRWNWL